MPNPKTLLFGISLLFLVACQESGPEAPAPAAVPANTENDSPGFTASVTPEAITEADLPPESTAPASPPQAKAKIVEVQPEAPQRNNNPTPPPPPTVVENDGTEIDVVVEQTVEMPILPSHTAFDRLLKKHVSATGVVDYQGFRADEATLDTYLESLSENPPDDLDKRDRLAYWINAYNAFTIRLILDNYPLASIRDLEKPWDRKWIDIGDKTYSLNNIEHDVIRPNFKEPRIHFALVCAAKSCPPLANYAFFGSDVYAKLDRRTRAFLRNEKYNVTQEEVIQLSPLFDWYAQDFGDVRTYVNKYLKIPLAEGSEIGFTEYDWSLNE